jgi:hypothetical protein
MASNVIRRMTHGTAFVKRRFFVADGKIRFGMSSKDTRLTFRITSDLKKKLESVAASEGRSVAQICEAFLRAGLADYQKDGTRYVRRFLSRHENES